MFRQVLFGEGYKVNFWMRTCAWMRTQPVLRYTTYPVALWMLQRQRYKLGISIPHVTQIGSGFYIGHFGGIVVHEDCKIGKNCNISQGVTIGQANRGERAGCPVIGDNVYIGPGAKIFGAITIGSDVAIGANCRGHEGRTRPRGGRRCAGKSGLRRGLGRVCQSHGL